VTRDELFEMLDRTPFDPTFAQDLKWTSGGTTEDPGPIV
jgi:hypothetical protein